MKSGIFYFPAHQNSPIIGRYAAVSYMVFDDNDVMSPSCCLWLVPGTGDET